MVKLRLQSNQSDLIAMRIEQLQAFLAIADIGNFGQAAKKCGVTQSTISRQIQSLEQDLGLVLFHRSNHAKLTLGGEKLLPHARKICTEWERAAIACRDLISGKQPELCVAAIHSVCSNYLPPVLQQFCLDYPKVQLRVTALGSDRALKVLRDGLVDVAIVMNNRLLTASSEMVVDLLYEEPIKVLMSAQHPLAQYQQVPWLELTKYPQAIFKDGYGMQRLVQEWFSHQNAEFHPVMELNTLDAFRGIVRQGEIIALLPYGAVVEAMSDPTLAVKSIQWPLNSTMPSVRQVVLVTTTDRLEIPPIAHFFKLVKQLIKPIGVNIAANGSIENSEDRLVQAQSQFPQLLQTSVQMQQ